jgi:hypothetical protein
MLEALSMKKLARKYKTMDDAMLLTENTDSVTVKEVLEVDVVRGSAPISKRDHPKSFRNQARDVTPQTREEGNSMRAETPHVLDLQDTVAAIKSGSVRSTFRGFRYYW